MPLYDGDTEKLFSAPLQRKPPNRTGLPNGGQVSRRKLGCIGSRITVTFSSEGFVIEPDDSISRSRLVRHVDGRTIVFCFEWVAIYKAGNNNLNIGGLAIVTRVVNSRVDSRCRGSHKLNGCASAIRIVRSGEIATFPPAEFEPNALPGGNLPRCEGKRPIGGCCGGDWYSA